MINSVCKSGATPRPPEAPGRGPAGLHRNHPRSTGGRLDTPEVFLVRDPIIDRVASRLLAKVQEGPKAGLSLPKVQLRQLSRSLGSFLGRRRGQVLNPTSFRVPDPAPWTCQLGLPSGEERPPWDGRSAPEILGWLLNDTGEDPAAEGPQPGLLDPKLRFTLLCRWFDWWCRDCVARAVDATNSFWLFFVTVGFQLTSDEERTRAVEDSLLAFAERAWSDLLCGRYEQRMKYYITSISSAHLDHKRVMPKRPSFMACDDSSGEFPVRGPLYRFFAARVNLDVPLEERMVVLSAWFSLKKRQPTIPAQYLRAQEDEWYEGLFGPAEDVLSQRAQAGQEPTPADWVDFDSALADVLGPLSRCRVPRIGLFSPSLAARYDSNRASLGAYGFISSLIDSQLAREAGLTIVEYPLGTFIGPDQSIDVTATVPTIGFSDLRELVLSYSGEAQALSGQEEEPLHAVSPVMLAEPFKVRPISKGRSLVSELARVYQKATHQLLQHIPSFRLTRESPDHDILDVFTEVIGVRESRSDEFWCSGDYKGSTDNLNPLCSERVATQFFLLLHPELRSVHDKYGLDGNPVYDFYLATLTGHSARRRGRWLPQVWGQLMGSPTSFPVLNVANAALTLLGLRRGGRPRLRFSHAGIVTNGDDVGFRATLAQIASWSSVTSLFGLAPSQGKNFISRYFLQLNSRNFILRDPEGSPWPALSKGVTDRLLYGGLHHAQASVLWSTFRSLPRPLEWFKVPMASLAVLSPPQPPTFADFILLAPSLQATFLDSFVGPERTRLNRLWLKTWGAYLRHLPTGLMNWFVPRCLGGFGLEPPDDTWSLNEGQARAAAWFRDHPQLERPRVRFGRVVALTPVYDKAQAVYGFLEKKGFLHRSILLPTDVPFRLPGLEGSLGLSGSLHLTRSASGAWSPSSSPPTPDEDVPPGQAQSDLQEFSRTLRLLRKAARSTERTMSKDQIRSFHGAQVGYVLSHGCTFVPGPDLDLLHPSSQVTHFLGNTGLVQYRPPGLPAQTHSETLLRLGGSRWRPGSAGLMRESTPLFDPTVQGFEPIAGLPIWFRVRDTLLLEDRF